MDPRYLIVLCAAMTQFMVIGGMFAYSVFFTVLEDELGWSRTLLSGASSLAFLVMGILAIVAGALSDRYGPRWVLSVTGIVTGLGWMLLAGMNQPWQLLLGFGFCVGVGLSSHDVATLSLVASWFEKRRGLMTGIVKSGTAVGQMLMPLVVSIWVLSFGWRTAMFILGAVSVVVLLIAAQGMRRPPATEQLRRSGGAESKTSGMTWEQARRSRTLWTLCAIQFCFFSSLMAVPVHLVAYATDMGLSTTKAAGVLSLVGGCSIAGRLCIGFLIDQWGGRRSMLMCFVPLLCSLVALRLADDPGWLFLIAPVYGFAHGGLFTVVSPTVAEFFGMRAHGALFGTILFFGTLGGAAGPLVTGMIFDSQGSYSLAFTGLAVSVAIGLVLVTSLPRFARRNAN